jgi:hypothetical protein
MSRLRRGGRTSGHSTCAAGPQNLSTAVRGMRWQGKDTKGGQVRRPFIVRHRCLTSYAATGISPAGLSTCPQRKHSNVWFFRSSRKSPTMTMFIPHFGQGGRSAMARSRNDGMFLLPCGLGGSAKLSVTESSRWWGGDDGTYDS